MRLSRWFTYFIIILSIVINLEFLFSQSILLDEAQSLWVAVKSVPTLLQINAQDVQVPLYTFILHFWLQILGTDIVIARTLSLIFFLMTLPILHKMVRETVGDDIAMLTVALFSVSPFILWYSSEARTYSLLTMLTSANHLYLLRMMTTRGRRGTAGFFLTSLAGVYSHYFFIFLLWSQFVYVVLFSWARVRAANQDGTDTGTAAALRRWTEYLFRSDFRTFTVSYVGSLLVTALLFVPWAVYVVSQGLASNTQPRLPAPSAYNVLQLFVNFVVGFQNANFQSLVVALWPLTIMVLFLIFTSRIRLRLRYFGYFMSVTFLPVITVFLVSFAKPIFLARYLIFTTPTLFMLTAWALYNYGRRLFAMLTTALIAMMFLFLMYQDWSHTTPVKENYRDVATYLSEQATAHDIIAVTAPFTVYPIEYYYTGQARIDSIPLWNRYVQGAIPAYSNESLKTQLTRYQSVYSRLFVVLSYDQGYQKSVKEFLDHNLELMGSYTYPSDITLRVYRLRYDIGAPTPPPPSVISDQNIDLERYFAPFTHSEK